MFVLKQTSSGCPEAYDVYLEGHYVGYMRLRHGYFAVYFGDTCVFSAEPKGDGIFKPEERDHFLNEGCKAIKNALAEREKSSPVEPLLFRYGGYEE